MIPYHPFHGERAFRERQVHMLRMVGDYGRLVGHRLAAEDLHRVAVAYAERERRLAEPGLRRPGIGLRVSSLREATGAALIRVGERLRGAPLPAVAPAEAPLA
ncbi:MAG: hypothetical protein M3Q03_12655 [Chloroflexota bacterium]|nr:hypothetical protein [Chloroflexota bacterium]